MVTRGRREGAEGKKRERERDIHKGWGGEERTQEEGGEVRRGT